LTANEIAIRAVDLREYTACTRLQGTGIRVYLPQLSLGQARYIASIGMAESDYHDNAQVLFYSVNPGSVLTVALDCLKFNVVGGGLIATGTGFVADADWNVIPAANSASSIAAKDHGPI
jgi:hypothetical protein